MTTTSGSRSKMRRPLATALVVAATALLLVASLAGPAVAKKPDATKLKMRPFNAFATAVSSTDSTLTATVIKGNHVMKAYMKANMGKPIAFAVDKDALILKVGAGDPAVIPLMSILTRDRLHIVGRVDMTNPSVPVFHARLILDRGPKPPTT
jgi:hypothetical protein